MYIKAHKALWESESCKKWSREIKGTIKKILL
jgi:hypothetical protein